MASIPAGRVHVKMMKPTKIYALFEINVSGGEIWWQESALFEHANNVRRAILIGLVWYKARTLSSNEQACILRFDYSLLERNATDVRIDFGFTTCILRRHTYHYPREYFGQKGGNSLSVCL
ncbi:hypothetical protein DBV15_05978 [Temnothorax longispinosus]|uniref:Uncharacterized protein n=1 Tax=Temnothorax longispinosus TaxID=300112 RepID=A0A4S2KM20_9HYME|nr:hypothetical protein DBV15_05978 [Temnothorax longispinosus]